MKRGAYFAIRIVPAISCLLGVIPFFFYPLTEAQVIENGNILKKLYERQKQEQDWYPVAAQSPAHLKKQKKHLLPQMLFCLRTERSIQLCERYVWCGLSNQNKGLERDTIRRIWSWSMDPWWVLPQRKIYRLLLWQQSPVEWWGGLTYEMHLKICLMEH